VIWLFRYISLLIFTFIFILLPLILRHMPPDAEATIHYAYFDADCHFVTLARHDAGHYFHATASPDARLLFIAPPLFVLPPCHALAAG
jgi:hypothetical protein